MHGKIGEIGILSDPVTGDLYHLESGLFEMALQPLIDRVFVGRPDHKFSAVHSLQRLHLGRQSGGYRDFESFGELAAKLAVAAERQSSKQRRAAEDNRVAVVLHQVRHRVFIRCNALSKSSSTNWRTVPVVLRIMKPSGNIL